MGKYIIFNSEQKANDFHNQLRIYAGVSQDKTITRFEKHLTQEKWIAVYDIDKLATPSIFNNNAQVANTYISTICETDDDISLVTDSGDLIEYCRGSYIAENKYN